MARRWAPQLSPRSRLLASALAATALCLAGCGAGAQPATPLTQRQLEGEPAAVAAWLRAHAARADRKAAAEFAKLAAQDEARRYWSAAAKAYAESAIHYPDPAIVLAYARVRTLELAGVRARAKEPAKITADAAFLLKLYQTAQAAQRVLGSLGAQQAAEADASIQCLSAPGAAAQVPTACPPLVTYRAEFERAAAAR